MKDVVRYKKLKRQRQRQRITLLIAIALILVGSTAWITRAFFLGNSRKLAWLDTHPKLELTQVIGIQPTPDVQVDNQYALQPLPSRQEDAPLKQKIEALLSHYPDRFKPHVFYYNLQDNHYVDINGEAAVPAASVIKLPILFTFFQQMDMGLVTPYQHLLYQDFEQAAGSGMMQYQLPGQPLLAKDVATQMIQHSDNTCTNILVYTLGGASTLNDRFEALGLKQTHIGNWLPDLGGSNLISMRDMTTILYNIDTGHLMSPTSRQMALDILKGTANRHLLPALLPKGTVMAQKTGDIGTALGNAGLVMLPDGRHYIVSMQVDRPYNDYGARDMFQQVSKLIYDDITAHPPALVNNHAVTNNPHV